MFDKVYSARSYKLRMVLSPEKHVLKDILSKVAP